MTGISKLLLFIMLTLSFCNLSFGQQKPGEVDKSPLDVTYFPSNYPILRLNGKVVEQPYARIFYSRPQKAGRTIFGNVVVYNNIWRLGANEATEIELFKAAKVSGKFLAKGRYTMFAICDTSKWTIIFNRDVDIWGLGYNSKKNVLSVEVPVQQVDKPIEFFTMFFDDNGKEGVLNIMWDNLTVKVPFLFS